MKLTDLEPRWGREWTPEGTPERHGQSINFLCPCGSGHVVSVPFANPIDGGAPMRGGVYWERQGDTIETLTLTPSINNNCGRGTPSCWHGFIRNGMIITV